MIVCDTGPLVAAADRDDQHNRACTDLLTGLHLARRAILVPAPVVAEVGYLLGRAGGAKIEAAFLRWIVQETLTIVDLELADYERMADLVEVYADFPLGTTDPDVVAVAERLSSVERPPGVRLYSDLPRCGHLVGEALIALGHDRYQRLGSVAGAVRR